MKSASAQLALALAVLATCAFAQFPASTSLVTPPAVTNPPKAPKPPKPPKMPPPATYGASYGSPPGDYSGSGGGAYSSPSPGGPNPTTGCKSKYHQPVSSLTDCQTICDAKAAKSSGATVNPTLYSYNGLTCCNCKFQRTPGAVPSPTPGGSTGTSPYSDYPSPSGVAPLSPTSVVGISPSPAGSYQVPTNKQMQQASDPTYVPNVSPGDSMVYTVLHVLGMPWVLPLPQDQIYAFIYAFNNVTGQPWQYKGADVSCVCGCNAVCPRAIKTFRVTYLA